MSWQADRTKPQYFHQKGWIANHFKVKNNLAALLRLRQRNHTELAREDQNGTIHHKSVELHREVKPLTAPEKTRRRLEGQQSEQSNPMVAISQQPPLPEGKYGNFKPTLNNRRQLLFLKPYTRNRNNSLTIDQRKTEIYQQINNPDLNSFNCCFQQNGPIEYLTEYSEPSTTRGEKEPPRPRGRSIAQHRTSLNVLREKLKKRCEMSFYQTKITRLNEP